MRKAFLFLSAGRAALVAVLLLGSLASDALACHRGKSHGSAGGCASGGCGQQAAAPSGGCSSGRCAWIELDADQLALVDEQGVQLGAYSRQSGLYRPRLAPGQWGVEVALSEPAARPATGIARK